MRIFHDYTGLSAALDLPADAPGAFRFLPAFMPAGFRCADCHLDVSFPTQGTGTGYAHTTTGEMICYDCADRRIVADMAAHTVGPFYCYLSGNALTVTTWTGGYLGRVLYSSESRSGWRGSKVWRFRVRDIAGREWNGRGTGPAMACTLRLAARSKLRATIAGGAP